MAQRVTGINVRRRRATTKKQREEEARIELEKLTNQLGELRGKLTEVTEKREAMTLPNLEGRKVEHSQYGEGTVSEQRDTVLTISYAGGVRKQKLPFVIASGCVTVDDSEATERCRRISDLETEQSRLKKEIQYRESWISDLQILRKEPAGLLPIYYTSPSFSSLSWSCSSTIFSLSGIGSPRWPAFSRRETPSLER